MVWPKVFGSCRKTCRTLREIKEMQCLDPRTVDCFLNATSTAAWYLSIMTSVPRGVQFSCAAADCLFV